MRCPSLQSLLEYVRAQLAVNERTEIALHLAAGCRSCQENLRWLEEAVGLAAADRSYALPEELILQVVAQFRVQPVTSSSPVRQFLAQLIFDSFILRPLAEVRALPTGSSAVAGRQLHYQTEDYDIDLRFERPEGSETEDVIGQILTRRRQVSQAEPPETVRLSVRLLRGEDEVESSQTDARGVFRFARIPSGIYNLRVRVPEGEINLDAVATSRVVS